MSPIKNDCTHSWRVALTVEKPPGYGTVPMAKCEQCSALTVEPVPVKPA